VKVHQEGYLVLVLRACGDADTEISKLFPETPDAEAALRDRAARLKANWGECSGAQRVIIKGDGEGRLSR
jgi:hypothetical protein